MSVHNEKRKHQCGSPVAAANGMVLFKATEYFAEWEKPYATMTVGPITKIVRDYIGMIMTTIKEDV